MSGLPLVAASEVVGRCFGQQLLNVKPSRALWQRVIGAGFKRVTIHPTELSVLHIVANVTGPRKCQAKFFADGVREWCNRVAVVGHIGGVPAGQRNQIILTEEP